MLIKKFFNVGFEQIQVVERRPCGLEELARYPLFAPEFLAFLREALPPRRHAAVVFSIVVTARCGDSRAARDDDRRHDPHGGG